MDFTFASGTPNYVNVSVGFPPANAVNSKVAIEYAPVRQSAPGTCSCYGFNCFSCAARNSFPTLHSGNRTVFATR